MGSEIRIEEKTPPALCGPEVKFCAKGGRGCSRLVTRVLRPSRPAFNLSVRGWDDDDDDDDDDAMELGERGRRGDGEE